MFRRFCPLLITLLLSYYCNGKQWLTYSASNMSKYSITGHAYVSFFKSSDAASQPVLIGAWGFSPQCGTGSFGYVEVEVRDDPGRKADERVSIAVSEEEFLKALVIKNDWESRRPAFTAANCVSFMQEISSAISGLKMPAQPQTLPQLFIKTVREVNRVQATSPEATNPANNQPTVPVSPLSATAKALFSPREDFKNYSGIEIANRDMETIAKKVGIKFDPVTKVFTDKGDESLTYPFKVFVQMIDFNKDKIPEIYINCFNYAYHGQIGNEYVFVKKLPGDYEMVLQQRGSASLLTTSNLGYPDILIGGPGLKAPGFRWNGYKYMFYRTYPFVQGNAPRFLEFKDVHSN